MDHQSSITSYIVFKSKGHFNTSYAPLDIHPINPWILYADQDNNIVIQNYINYEKILNFSISQHDEEKRELLLLQKRVPTLSSLSAYNSSGNSGSSSPSNLGTVNLSSIGNNSGNTVSSSSSSQNGSIMTSPPQTTTQSVNSSTSSLSSTSSASSGIPTSPVVHTLSISQTMMHRSPNNTVAFKSSLDSSGYASSSGGVGNASLDQSLDKIEKLGQIKFLYFFDRHTRSLKDRKPKTSQGKLNLNVNKQSSSSVGIDDYIVVVAENRIVFINYHSQRLREVKIPAFETKSPTSIEFFSNSPLVAFGGPDSVIRLWNTDKWELERQFTGGHPKGSIVKLKSIEMDGDYLVSGGTDGFTCVWNVRTGALASQFPKVHEILDLTFDHVSGNILALTVDRNIVVYDIVAMKEISKISCGKKEFFSIDPFYHPRFPHDLMLSMKSPAQVSYFSRSPPPSGQPREYIIDFDNLLGTAKKEKSKLYKVIPHPLIPHLMLCWINKNLYLISTLATSTPMSVTAFNPTTNDHTVYFPHQGFLHYSSLTNILTTEKIATPIAIPNEYIKLDISASGKYLSILQVSSGQYQIIEIGTWKVVEKDNALDIAWSGRGKNTEKFGKLEAMLSDTVDPVKKKKISLSILPGKSTKKEEQVVSKILLKTKEFSNNITQELLLHANEDKISGGLLLGVYHREKDSGSGSSVSSSSQPVETPVITSGEETESKSFHLLDWWTLQPVGESLPPPLKIYWDQSQTHCAIAYTHHFCVFKLRPSFHMLCRWPYSLTSAVWHNNTLFFSTHNDIQCLFPHKHESAPIVLASSSGNVFPEDLYDVSSGSLSNSKPNQTFSLFPNFRPSGSISLVEVNNEGLVVLDSNYKFYCIPLTHYLLKFFILAQMEAYDLAMKCATMVDPKYHYLMAKFLTVRGHPKECLQLTGISNFLKFLICINNEAYEASLDIVPLLADAIRSKQVVSNENTNEEITLSYLGKMCIEIGQKSQNKNDYPVAERAFKMATTLEPHSAFQELALHYVLLKKMNELKELQQSIQQNYPIESNLIALLID
eukprot:gene11147-13657_t